MLTRNRSIVVAIVLGVAAVVLTVFAVDAARAPVPTPLASASADAGPPSSPDVAPSVQAQPSVESDLGSAGGVAVERAPQALPTRLEVPKIGIDTELEELGLLDDGSLATPEDTDLAGWFEGGPRPGAVGPAVIAGHVSWNGDPSVFFRLTELEPGDAIDVQQADGAEVTFEVTRIEQHPKDDFPTVSVYANTDSPELRLITCGGEFDSSTGHFDDNIVVFASLVDA